MPPDINRRSKPRVFVGPEFTIQFVAKGHPFQDVRITNVSVDGCFATVPGHDGALFTKGTVLENLVLVHPELPRGPVTATTMYVLGGETDQEVMEFVGLGIHFTAMDAETSAALQRWVDLRLA